MAKNSEDTVDDLPQVKIAVMNNDIKHINETMNRLETKFDAAIQNFATNQQLLDAQGISDLKHKEFEKKFDELEASVSSLKETDDRQQGAIEANSRSFNRTVAVITVIGVVLSALWWIPAILQKG